MPQAQIPCVCITPFYAAEHEIGWLDAEGDFHPVAFVCKDGVRKAHPTEAQWLWAGDESPWIALNPLFPQGGRLRIALRTYSLELKCAFHSFARLLVADNPEGREAVTLEFVNGVETERSLLHFEADLAPAQTTAHLESRDDAPEYPMTALEEAFWREQLEDFVPKRVFDAHVHVWDERFATPQTPESGLRVNADAAALHRLYGEFLPRRDVAFQLVGSPVERIDFAGENRWFCEQLAASPEDVGALLVTPQTPPARVAELAEANPALVALKPYFCYADGDGGWLAGIADYLPEALVEVADHYRLNIVLHLSRPLKCADAGNLATLREWTRRYPRVEWQLAHCACAFSAPLLEKALPQLRDMDHIFYDTSAVCDQYAFELLLKHEDPSRILYGTDLLPGSAGRGKFHPYALGWVFQPGGDYPWCQGEAIRLLYEELLAFRRACKVLEIPRAVSDAIFFGNHRRHLLRRQQP